MSSTTPKLQSQPVIWLARKAEQAELVAGLRRRGIATLNFSPLIAVPNAAEEVAAQLQSQPTVDAAVFVSPTAVDIFHQQIPQGLPRACRVYGPGSGTAAALASHSYALVEHPSKRFNSESLLSLKSLQGVAGQHILIISGDSGRPLIEQTLQERGATTQVLACYRREPVADWSEVLGCEFSHALFSSSEAYRAAASALGAALNAATIVATSARLEAEIRGHGFAGKLVVSDSISAETLAKLISAI